MRGVIAIMMIGYLKIYCREARKEVKLETVLALICVEELSETS